MIGIILYLYTFSLPFIFALFWFWISYVDRLHLRETTRIFGTLLYNKLIKYKHFDKIQNYIIIQLNSLSEVVAGLTDGLMNKNPIIKICNITQNECQTDIILYEKRDVEIQTEIINIVVENIVENIIETDHIFDRKDDKTKIISLQDDETNDKNISQSSIKKRIKLTKIKNA